MALDPWISDESRIAPVARRLLARAAHRWSLVLVMALLATGVIVAGRALRAPSYEATLFFRLGEGDLTEPRSTPRPPSSIREYISSVALSRSQLQGVMDKYHISRARLARDPVGAVDDFREDIRLEVSRNYFLYDRQAGDAPRSALVAISLSGSDAERTRAILREIGDAIVRDQETQRGLRLQQARQHLGAQLELARERARMLQGRIERLWPGAAHAKAHEASGSWAEIAALQAEASAAVEQVLSLERRAADVAFTVAAERKKLGLNFELFDESLVATAPRLSLFHLALRAALVFPIALLLTMAVVGAFDDRIYGPEDLAARALPVFGALPAFPGDDASSYGARSRMGSV